MAQQLHSVGRTPERLLLIDSFNSHYFSAAAINELYNSLPKTFEDCYLQNQEKRYQKYLSEYIPQKYHNEVFLLKASRQGRIPDEIYHSKFRGWEQTITKLNLDTVDGDHDSIFENRYSHSLAKKIMKYIKV